MTLPRLRIADDGWTELLRDDDSVFFRYMAPSDRALTPSEAWRIIYRAIEVLPSEQRLAALFQIARPSIN